MLKYNNNNKNNSTNNNDGISLFLKSFLENLYFYNSKSKIKIKVFLVKYLKRKEITIAKRRKFFL
jgi:hypothetical protein